ncbi:type I polyketide synthase [Streptomyces buecherae]|uniref:type I polyketide synthase n=5 Tax=Streptomyces buecherae TaxID=2763006 RepID=UPI003FD89230
MTADLRQTQRRLKDVESASHEPVAIVGMACRFPGGVRSPEELWELVVEGRDAVSEVPTDRNWDLDHFYDPDPEHPGTSYAREGGFLDDPAGFDAAFFGISPREALGMAPQQRLALEASWEAIEHAGINPESLRGSQTGTFIGCDHLDYVSDESQVPEGSAGYFTIGNSASVVSGRVAYTLGLEGAAVTVDTACSSSLVAMHLACQAIRQGECDMALAGGAAVMSSTAPFIGFSELRGLAPDGRSKPFSQSADGISMAEGVGVLLLERLSDARRNGHQVLAVIRGTAVNQDGASNGLTAPNGPAQQRVIRQALANARLTAADVDAVEAHGTGTALGDPIEAQALLATYGQDRPEDRPLWLGSIKSNIGHSQMAAGAAGVIKMVLAMRHQTLPASLHIDEPTQHVDWSSGAIQLLTEAVAWPEADHPRRAGVSSFGISGTNAHVVLEQAPLAAEFPPDDLDAADGEPAGDRAADAEPAAVTAEPATGSAVGGPVPWLVSARSAAALRGQARALAERVTADPDLSPLDVGWSLATTRAHFEHRAVVVGEDRDALLASLHALAEGDTHPALIPPTPRPTTGDTVFLFSGQGSQRPGMGRELYDRFPVYAQTFDQVCDLLGPYLDHPLREVVFTGGPDDLLNHTTYAQAGLFALQVAMARLLETLGVRPDAVIGHSIGEVAAAHIAGILDLPDACHLVAQRATLMGTLPTGGAMATLNATPEELQPHLDQHQGQVSIAALNTPGNTVISGPTEAVETIRTHWAEQGRKARSLTVSHAFHSAQMDLILDPFTQALSTLTFHAPTIPLISNLTGQPADPDFITTPTYWAQHIRQPVHFHQAITHTAPTTHTYLELGPDPTLTTATQHTLHHLQTHPTTQPTHSPDGQAAGDAAEAVAEAGHSEGEAGQERPEPLVVAALQRKQGDVHAFTRALAQLHAAGAPLNWPGWFPADPAPRVVGLPTYAFEHQRFWLESPVPRGAGGAGVDAAESQLWHAIEELDVEALSSTLKLDQGSPGFDALLPALPVLSAWRRQHRERSVVDSWRYEVRWKRLADAAPVALSGAWLLVVPAGFADHPAVQTATQALTGHGVSAVDHLVVEAGGADRSGLAGEIGERVAGGQPAGVLSLLALDETAHPAHPGVPAGLAATIALVRALGDAAVSAPLWCLTQGAVATGATDPLPHPRQAQMWGLGRVAALEHADRWGGLIDLPTTIDHHTARRLATLLAPGQAEDQAAIRGAVFARRLRQAPEAADDAPWRPTDTTLITGGTGGLGARVARWLAENGAPRLLLASRSGPDAAGAGELAAQLTALGAAVDIVSCDVADRDQLQRLLADIPTDQPLSAVVHTAGVLEVDTLAELDLAALDRTLDAKAVAAAHLHELTRDLDLSAFVLFSSNAATWGSGRQAGYAAANAYLDALAEHRRAHGLPATSIAWGPWGGTGMAADEAGVAYLKRRGLSPLDPHLGIASLQGALGRGDTTITVADVDWEKFTTGFTAQRPSPLLSDVAPVAPAVAEAVDAMAASPLRQQLAEGTPADQHRVLLEHVQRHAATILGHASPDAVSPTVPFQELGFDSITAVELRNQLATSTGITIAPTLVFDHPTPHAVATYLRGQLTGQRATAAARPASVVGSDEPIAIVGMACRYPGGVRSPRDLWELVVEGRDAIAGMPTDRNWDLDTLFHPDPEHLGTSYANEGGFLYEAAEFDAAFFGISPREALAMDPQQRLLLETAWETFESAGLDREALNGSDTGVFAGGTFQGYGATGTASAQEVEGYLLAGGTPSVLSGRLAYSFGLEGPAMTVDTACSSSLVAMHLAAQALRQGECGLALAGGVTVMATPTTFVEFSRQRGLAADGRCKPFAAAADGTGWGEGAGLVLLERLSDARRNGRRILAVLRGSAINQDGTSNGLTAPNGPSQQRVIGQALANARLSPAEVDVVEAHGTGTTLGDPIEAQALLATYGQDRPEGRPLWLGSIKSNIGHTQAASGVAGVIKMVEAMRHGVLPASLHIDAPTPHVDWDAGEVRLLTERAAWPQADRPRRAGVSSFGISGTNAHLILEQPPAALEPAPVASPAPVTAESAAGSAVGWLVPWLVSARSAAALRGQAKALAERVTADPDLSPLDVGWSLATTRAHFEHRAVAVGENHEQLLAALTALANGETHPHLTHPDTEATAGAGDTVFLFSGQGSQRPGMGRELYDRFPVYAETFDQVCDLLDPYLDHSLREVVFTGGPDDLLNHTTYAQAGLFALQVAMARLLETLGVRPDAVIGHSIGEVAAAHIAGVLDLPDACHLVAQRATLMGTLPTGGAMATLNATPEELQPHLDQHQGQVSIAALNTPGNTVISGPTEAVETIRNHWAEQGRKARSLTVSHAFHSPQMDPILDAFTQALSTLTFHAPAIPLISNLTGQPADPDFITTPTYWAQHIRQPVHFHQAITHTTPTTHTYLELGPDPTLTTATQHTLHHLQSLTVDDEDTERPAVVVAATLSRKKPEAQAFAQALGALHAHGVRVDWTGWFPVSPAPRVVELPTYAFQHQRFWLAAADPVEAVGGAGQSAAEVELWDAVERGDLAALARTLDSPEEQRPMLDAVLPTLSAWRRQHRERSVIDSWRYRAVWTPITDLPPAALDGSWLLVVPVGFEEHPVTHIATQALSGYGASVVRYLVTGTSERDEVTDGLDELAVGVTFSGVVSLLALDENPHPDYPAVPTGLATTTTLIQALNNTTITAPLWTLTQGATTTHTTDPLPNPHQAHTWGLARVAALEHPHHIAGLIDLPTNPNHHTTHHLATLLTQTPNQTHPTHDQTAIRNTPLTRRLHHTPTPNNPIPTPWKPTGTTLITGGTGALATHITRWLAHQNAPHIILTSRTGPNAPHTQTLTQELNHLNTTITITTCDITNRNQLQQLLNTIPTHQPLTTIIHTAGIAENTPFEELDLPHLDAVLRPKSLGALHLHELTREMKDVSAFVLFSSGAATWGGSRQGAYAAANTYLDALAEHRRAHGLPATSIAWAPWAESGMAADDAASAYYSRRGMNPLPPELAVKALHQALTHNDTTITIADIDWHKFPASFTAQRPSPLLAHLTPAPAATAEVTSGQPAATSALAQQLADSTPGQQQQIVLHHIQTTAAQILGHASIDAVPATQPFQDLGFDSLTAVELRNQLASSTGLDLTPALIFDHPTPKELADFLREQLADEDVASEGRLLTELDRWDAASESADVDEAARRRITGRLQLLLAKWSDTGRETDRSAAHSDLEAASAEDIFDLISDEFGKS